VSSTCSKNSSHHCRGQSGLTMARPAMKCSLNVAMAHLVALMQWLWGGTRWGFNCFRTFILHDVEGRMVRILVKSENRGLGGCSMCILQPKTWSHCWPKWWWVMQCCLPCVPIVALGRGESSIIPCRYICCHAELFCRDAIWCTQSL